MGRVGLLLVNLGSPEAPTWKSVYAYLCGFLSDRYVIDLPFLPRQALVRAVIAPLRARATAANYRKIWTERGSPLVGFTRDFTDRVAAEMAPRWDVRWAMRYGSPAIGEVLADWKVDKIYLVPLYPQYAESSTRTAVERAALAAPGGGSGQGERGGRLEVLQDFYDEPEFIDSLVTRISGEIGAFAPDHVLLSYHGLPEHHVRKLHPAHCLRTSACCAHVNQANRLCYRAQCHATTRALIARLDFPAARVSLAFQSRLGRRPWIKPYTDQVIVDLATGGVRRVLVSCPSFVADCLETLDEVQIRLREQFRAAGGEDLRLVPALNDSRHWVVNFSRMVERKVAERKFVAGEGMGVGGKSSEIPNL